MDAQEDDPDALTDEQAARFHYRGNSISYWIVRAEARGKGIDESWDALRSHGVHPDGWTALWDAIRSALAARDARIAALHRELRGLAIDSAGFDTRTGYDAMMCLSCSCKWWKGASEEHITECLAAPATPQPDAER